MSDLFEGAFDYSTIADVPTCVRAAKRLDELHRGCPSEHIYTEGQNLIGFLGERLFGMTALCAYRPRIHLVGGDEGADFTAVLQNGWGAGRRVVIDVKSTLSRRRQVIMVPADRVKPITDVYVLARVHDIDTGAGELFGWAWKQDVLRTEPERASKGNFCHVVKTLHPMVRLWDRGDDFRQHIREGVAEVPY